MTLGVKAQEKVLTMEEAILGYRLSPQNRNLLWQGDKNVLTYIEGKNLMGESVEGGEKQVLMTLEELNRILDANLEGWPSFSWKDGNSILIMRQGKLSEILVEQKGL